VSSGATLNFNLSIGSGQQVTAGSGLISSLITSDNLTVLNGGVVEVAGATVLGGGVLSLAPGATIQSATVAAGGALNGTGEILGTVYDQGAVSGVSVSGNLEVAAKGVASGVVMVSGALQVDSGGFSVSAQINSGATEVVSSGASVSGTIVNSGGTLEHFPSRLTRPGFPRGRESDSSCLPVREAGGDGQASVCGSSGACGCGG
jgi:autotransporter passenger strand-loop-strand repeat protein